MGSRGIKDQVSRCTKHLVYEFMLTLGNLCEHAINKGHFHSTGGNSQGFYQYLFSFIGSNAAQSLE